VASAARNDGLFDAPQATGGERPVNRGTPEAVLKEVFGFSSFKPLQREIIGDVMAGRDCVAILPTGAGKSLCYQIPALLLGGPTLVVSPLIALMRDQVSALAAAGVEAEFINSSLGAEERRAIEARVRSGSVKLLYAAPESLAGDRVTGLFAEFPPALIVVDEAHCVSEWGHDFRPEYRNLSPLRRRFPRAAWLAVSATATARVRADIAQNLGLREPSLWLGGFERPNLRIRVEAKAESKARILSLARARKGSSGIVYCASRKRVESLAAALSAAGIRAAPYHAGMAADHRSRTQEAFVRDDIDVIVATIAFGMGIDKPDVRFVIHADLPKSVENYYQEIGRAGRDGLDAECILLYSPGDAISQARLFEELEPEQRRQAQARLDAMRSYAESDLCRRRLILSHFGESPPGADCGHCDNCRGEAREQADYTVPALKLLSCVKRSGERFGAAHAVDILLGERTEKVERFGHALLSTFGIGAELPRAAWLSLARRLVATGHLVRDPERSTLSLTASAYELFKNRGPYMAPALLIEGLSPGTGAASGPGEPARQGGAKSRRKARAKPREEPTLARIADGDEAGAELYMRLRALRKDLADGLGVPPYVVFPDRTLREMASSRPRDEEALSAIYGVGSTKLQRYGSEFLKLLNA
jgi:ATP-dependent DNA helicase RecQ